MLRRMVPVLLLAMVLLLSACGAATAPVATGSVVPTTVSPSTEPSSSASQTSAEASPSSEASASATASTSASAESSASPSASASNGAEPATATTTAGTALSTGRTNASINGKDIKVKAVYVSGPMAGVKIDHYIDLVNRTELNALVIDIKEGGIVNYETNAATCRALGLYKKYFKVDEVLKKCHDNGIYVIGRIVVFRDDLLAKAKPEFAIKTPSGGFWLENKNKDGAWTSPAVQGVLDYNIEIAKEAVERGFDEIQFDYVRFPTVPKSNPAAYPESMPDKITVIDDFLQQASKHIKAVREVPISADVFGIIAESVSDGKAIGQQLEMLGANADYLSPMVYPSHYANAGKGVMGNGVGQQINGVAFTAPDLDPHGVVYQSLMKVQARSSASTGFKAGIRPYLQDFTASYIKNKAYYQTYGPEQVRQQIQAVYDAGYEEWILWNGRNQYSEGGLLPESGQ